ncbi:MAG: DUF3943 domain-containing protein [Bdellovibrionota bacterium]
MRVLSGWFVLLCIFMPASARSQELHRYVDADAVDAYRLPHLLRVADSSESSGNLSAAAAEQSKDGEKSYILPAFEIVGFQVLLNLFDRNVGSEKESYRTDLHTIHHNFESDWEFDRDSFDINQIGHPYQGSVYYNLARSSGLNFYESFGYTFAGSYLWEIAGETTKPSVNDQITTSFGGTFLGEALFRTGEVFFRTADRTEAPAPTVAGAITAPAADFNRAVLDKPVTPDLRRQHPAMYRAVELGYANNVNVFNAFDTRSIDRNLGEVGFDIVYGIPGKAGYEYRRPFDYFDLDAALSTSTNDTVDHIFVNGLIYGQDYEAGDSFRGIFGLYGNYNYLAPEIFRVGSSALSLGSTGQWSISPSFALQSSVLGGVGFGSGGTIHATEGGRDYHYGAVPQGSALLRVVYANMASFELSGQEFFVSGPSSDPSGDSNENIARVHAALTLKVSGPHAVGLQYTESQRNAPFKSSPDQHQRVSTAGIFYTYVFGGDFAATRF